MRVLITILRRLLEPETNKSSANETQEITYKDSGPSDLDKWSAIIEDEENCWADLKDSPDITPRKKIIYSYPPFVRSTTTLLEFKVWQTLIEHYDIYIWQGPSINIKSCIPMKDISELFKEKRDNFFTNELEIKKALGQQGIGNIDDEYIILDYGNYQKLLRQLSELRKDKKPKTDFESYLRMTEDNFDETEIDISSSKVSRLQADYQTRINLGLHALNELPLDDYTDKDLSFDQQKKITIRDLFHHKNDSYLFSLRCQRNGVLPQDKRKQEMRQLQLTTTAYLQTAKEQRSHHNLEGPDQAIVNANNAQGYYTHDASTLTHQGYVWGTHKIKIKHPFQTSTFLYEKNVEHLIIEESPNLIDIQMPDPKQLKQLEIKNSPGKLLTNPGIITKTLEKLTIDKLTVETDPSDYTTLNLNTLAGLTYLNLREPFSLNFTGLLQAENLTELHLEMFHEEMKIDWSNLIQLKQLSIKYAPGVNLPTTFNLPNLEILTIEHYFTSSELPLFKQLHQLKKLNLINANPSYFLDFPDIAALPLLEELNIQDVDIDKSINFGVWKNLRHLSIALTYPSHNIDLSHCRLETFSLPTESPVILGYQPALLSLEITIDNLSDINFDNLPALEELVINLNKFSSKKLALNSQSLNNLKSLTLNHSLDNTASRQTLSQSLLDSLSQLSELEEIIITNSVVPRDCKMLDFSRFKKLKILIIEGLDFDGEISLTKTPIEFFHLTNSNVSKIHLQNCGKLRRMDLTNNKKLSPAFEEATSLEILNYILLGKMSSALSMNLRKNTNLKNVNIKILCPNLLTLEGSSSLENLTIHSNNNVNLDLSGCKNLFHLIVNTEQPLSPVDLSDCKNLQFIEVSPECDVFKNTPPSCQITLTRPLRYSPDQSQIDESHDSIPDTRIVNLSPPIPKKEDAVGVFRYGDFLKAQNIDCDLTSNPSHRASGNVKATLYADKLINKNKQCIGIYDEIHFDPNTKKITFRSKVKSNQLTATHGDLSSFDKNQFDSLKRNLASNQVAGYIEATELVIDEYYPLVTHQAIGKNDLTIYCNPPQAVKIFWHEAKQTFYIQPQSENFSLLYQYTKNQYYDNKHYLPLEIESNSLDKELTSILRDSLQNFQPLKFLYNTNLTSKVKLDELVLFCKNEQNNSDNNNSGLQLSGDKSDVDLFLQTLIAIHQGKAECRHRAEALMILARAFLTIPVRTRTNEIHMFGEIPYKKDSQLIFSRCDLGGVPVVDLTPANVRQNIFENPKVELPLHAPLPESVVDEKSKHSDKNIITNNNNNNPIEEVKPQLQVPLPPEQQAEKDYYQAFENVLKVIQVDNMDELFSDQFDLIPLIELTTDQNPFVISARLMEYIDDNRPLKECIYLHSPQDIALFFQPKKLVAGERKKINGPLYNIALNGGTIIINWSNFNSTQIASFKSMMDDPPTLLGLSLNKPKVKVIGLTAPNNKGCSAFLTRCQKAALTPQSLKPRNLSKKILSLPHEKPVLETLEKPKLATLEIDLFHRINWRTTLLGEILFEGDTIELIDLPFIEALKVNKPLNITIVNPPRDPRFMTLLERLKAEKRIFYNGQYITFSDKINIQTAHKNHPTHLVNVTLTKEIDQNDSRERIYLGLHNLNECLETLTINENHQAKTVLQGYLHKIDVTKQVFYLTGHIPLNEWQYLLSKMALLPEKQFTFILAPGASVEGLLNHTITPQVDDSTNHNNIIISNDTDYCTTQLANQLTAQDSNNNNSKPKKVLIIDVTLETTLNDLVAQINYHRQENTSHIDFTYEQKDMLKAMLKGRDVILNGILSKNLYEQLLPFISPNAAMYSNGKKITSKGRLFLVQPESVLKTLPIPTYKKTNYSLSDYKKNFSTLDHEWIDRIAQFYDAATKLPHRGFGRPAHPKLEFAHLKLMVARLKNNAIHEHNPIKGLFNYDYPQNSEDYAYLNVYAKFIFKRDDTSAIRLRKLKELMEEHHISSVKNLKPYVWQILNCFRGEALHQFFGDALVLDDANLSFPNLNDETLERLWTKVQDALQQPLIHTQKEDHVTKRERILNKLLNDSKSPIIMIKGEAGVGKTHSVRHLQKTLNFNYYENEEEIIAWLTDTKGGKKVLLLDEANLARPGVWDFLKGLSRDQKNIYYKGRNYPLTEDHKLIVTGNPEHFPGRYYHHFIQNYSETIYFKMPDDSYLENIILKNLLSKHTFDNQVFIIKTMHMAYQLIETYVPTYKFSIRDLENLAKRFLALSHAYPQTEQNTLLFQACRGEFEGMIYNQVARLNFVNQLAAHLNLAQPARPSPLIKLTDKVTIAEEHVYLYDAIQQDLLLRNEAIAENKDAAAHSYGYYKQGILLEGDSGLGKSTLLKAILEANGFSAHAVDTQKRYYEITAGNKQNVREILTKAYQEGSVVILDELNLDETLEKILIEILTPRHNLAKQSETFKEGFMIFSSQNPGDFAGRCSVSPALRNRMHFLYMIAHSDKALTAIANLYGIPWPEMFVKAYRRIKKTMDVTNIRTFFTVLKKYVSTPISVLQPNAMTRSNVDSSSQGVGALSIDETKLPTVKVAINFELRPSIDTLLDRLNMEINPTTKGNSFFSGKLSSTSLVTYATEIVQKSSQLTSYKEFYKYIHAQNLAMKKAYKGVFAFENTTIGKLTCQLERELDHPALRPLRAYAHELGTFGGDLIALDKSTRIHQLLNSLLDVNDHEVILKKLGDASTLKNYAEHRHLIHFGKPRTVKLLSDAVAQFKPSTKK
ncbi:MAG: AAA family ATPase [Gammaproteobacteria bacterium]|nr:AAA family ATPase [Gammaproteobacteria bacterium]